MTPGKRKMRKRSSSRARNLVRSSILAFGADGFVTLFTASSIAGNSGRFGVIEQAGTAVAAGLAATGALCLHLSKRTERAHRKQLEAEAQRKAEELALAQQVAALRDQATREAIVVPPPAQRHQPVTTQPPAATVPPVRYIEPEPEPATSDGLATLAIGE